MQIIWLIARICDPLLNLIVVSREEYKHKRTVIMFFWISSFKQTLRWLRIFSAQKIRFPGTSFAINSYASRVSGTISIFIFCEQIYICDPKNTHILACCCCPPSRASRVVHASLDQLIYSTHRACTRQEPIKGFNGWLGSCKIFHCFVGLVRSFIIIQFHKHPFQ